MIPFTLASNGHVASLTEGQTDRTTNALDKFVKQSTRNERTAANVHTETEQRRDRNSLYDIFSR